MFKKMLIIGMAARAWSYRTELYWNFANWRKIGVNVKAVGFRISAMPHILGLAIHFG